MLIKKIYDLIESLTALTVNWLKLTNEIYTPLTTSFFFFKEEEAESQNASFISHQIQEQNQKLQVIPLLPNGTVQIWGRASDPFVLED